MSKLPQLSKKECYAQIEIIAKRKGYTSTDLNNFAKSFINAEGKPSFFSKLKTEELNLFIDLLTFNDEKGRKLEPVPPITNYIQGVPTVEDFQSYYNILTNLGFKFSTITTVVTALRKTYAHAPAFQMQAQVTSKTHTNNQLRRLINNKVFVSDLLNTLDKLKESQEIEHIYLYLALVSGRRESELLTPDSFGVAKKGLVLFKGQKKLKGRNLQSYYIPIIGSTATFLKKLELLHAYQNLNPKQFTYIDHKGDSRLFNNRVHRKFQTVKTLLCRDEVNWLKPHTLRALYAQYCNLTLNKGKLNDLTYYTNILGHAKDDIGTQNHYKLVQLVDDRASEIKPTENLNLLPYGFNAREYADNLEKIKKDEIYTRFVAELKVWYDRPKEFFTLPPALTADYKKLSYVRRNFIKSVFTLPTE